MLEFKNISYRYRRGGRDAVHGVNLTVPSGMHLLLGENGAGKTTLLKLGAGLLIPSSGECLLNGSDISRRIPEVLQKIFYLGGDTTAPFSDIETIVKRHACFFPSFDSERLDACLADFGLDRKMKMSRMSLGTHRKALLAYALSLGTDVLMLDEPTIGLDMESKEKLRGMLIDHLGEDRTVIVATHIVTELDTLYDGVSVMRGSEIAASASADEIENRLTFTTSYSEMPGALFSSWSAGMLFSILEREAAEAAGVKPVRPDYALLYAALHSKSANRVLEVLNPETSNRK